MFEETSSLPPFSFYMKKQVDNDYSSLISQLSFYYVQKAEYQDKIKLKFSPFQRQHSPCVPLSGIFKKLQ